MKITFGTIVMFFHRDGELPNESKISPAIVTRPWSQNSALNLTVIPDCNQPQIKSSALHADSLEYALNSGNECWATVEECEAWGLNLDDAYEGTVYARRLQNSAHGYTEGADVPASAQD